jgi:orotate phosphoribosyltransferase
MTVHMAERSQHALDELIARHRRLYDGPAVESKLQAIIREAPNSKLSDWDVHRILRTSRSVFFDTHVEVVSGHHTATYLRFGSIAKIPQLIRLISRDMADWLRQNFVRDLTGSTDPIAGIVATASDAQHLAEGVADVLRDILRLRVVLTPFDEQTGKIGTDLVSGAIRAGERFVVLNDVTTRGNCVSKLGKVVTDHGGVLAGMAVFARRDSGQFPLMEELPSKHRFYWTADLLMPQWEPDQCPLCQEKKTLLSWRDIPEID